jgi:hypothetical protein
MQVLLAGFLPGALLGIHLAGLIFFLNPEVPFEPVRILRGVVYYGGALGLGSLLVCLPFLWRQRQRALRALPWGLTVGLAGAALLDGAHASIFAFFVPPGINVRLLKTASWLAFGAVLAFYTALLHSVHRRRYGWRSRVGFLIFTLGSVYVMVERREAFRLALPAAPLASVVELGERPDLLVVGLDAATLDAILPLAEEGELPFLSQVLAQGATGRLASLSPFIPRALWATLSTGKYPYRHRTLGPVAHEVPFLGERARLQLLPRGLALERWGVGRAVPLPAGESQVLRLWEILPLLGVPVGVVGWPGADLPVEAEALAPGEPWPLFLVSDGFLSAPEGHDRVIPTDLRSRAPLFRAAAEELDDARFRRLAFPSGRPVREAWVEDRFREILTGVLWDQFRTTEAVFVGLPGLRVASEGFYGGYLEVRFEGAQHREYLRAADVLRGYYSELDGLLARLWEGRRGPTILAVVSAYGCEGPVGWRRAAHLLAGGRPVRGYVDGSPEGVVLLFGAGISPGVRLPGMRLVDLAPTLLYGLGLPVARDLDGRIRTEAFQQGFLARHPLTFLPSYETLLERRTTGP